MFFNQEDQDKSRQILKKVESTSDLEEISKLSTEIPKLKVPEIQASVSQKMADVSEVLSSLVEAVNSNAKAQV